MGGHLRNLNAKQRRNSRRGRAKKELKALVLAQQIPAKI